MFHILDFLRIRHAGYKRGKSTTRLKQGISKPYQWRIIQLDSLERLLKENIQVLCIAITQDFKVSYTVPDYEITAPIALIEYTRLQLHEWIGPKEQKSKNQPSFCPLSLAEQRCSGTLLLLFTPVIASISSGSRVLLKANPETPVFNEELSKLFPRYFKPSDVAIISLNPFVV